MQIESTNINGTVPVTDSFIELQDGTLLACASNGTFHLKVTPITKSGSPIGSITKVTATSDNGSVIPVSVNQYNIVTYAQKRGEATVTITAEDEVNGYSATIVLNFKVIKAADAIDVISGESEDISGINLEIKGDYFGSVSYKVNDLYKDILKLKSSNNFQAVNRTEQDGVVTVHHDGGYLSNQTIPGTNDILVDVNSTGDVPTIGMVYSQFFPEEGVEYPLTGAPMKMYIGTVPYPEGSTINVNVGESNLKASFQIEPGCLVKESHIVTEVTSSDDSVVTPGTPTQYRDIRRIPMQVLSAGTATIMLHVTDGMDYDETTTFTVVVSAQS